jgi:hypothetical protein
MQQSFEVGEALYILSKKGTTNVVPAIVVEVVTKTTISGASTSYKVLASTAKGNFLFDLSKLEAGEGDIFTNPISLQEEILNRMNILVTETMSRIGDAVAELQKECLVVEPDDEAQEAEIKPTLPEKSTKANIIRVEEMNDGMSEIITLPNGQKAKARLKLTT